MNGRHLINSYLVDSLLLQVATSTNGIPWICTVCFAFDADFNLYWFSRHDTRHSQEIVLNPRVAGAVAAPFALGDKPKGLQFDGTAMELYDKEDVALGLTVMRKRYGVTNIRTDQLMREVLSRKADYGLYRLHPDTIILYDKLNFPESPRHVYKIQDGTIEEETA